MGKQAVSALGNGSVRSQSSSDELFAALDLLLLSTGYKKKNPTLQKTGEKNDSRAGFHTFPCFSVSGFCFKFGVKKQNTVWLKNRDKGFSCRI